jgi:hypothetical protein
MSDHVVTVELTSYEYEAPALSLECSCGATVADLLQGQITLSDLADLADVHIARAEADTAKDARDRWLAAAYAHVAETARLTIASCAPRGFGPPTQHVNSDGTVTVWAGIGADRIHQPRQQVLKPSPAEYVHGLDQPDQDPRRGVLGDG